MRTIRVTGKGKIKVRPDMTRITLSLEGKDPEYGETLKKVSENTEKIKELLSGFGFDRADLKTLNFRVDPEYESYQVKGVYKQKFVGYRYMHQLKVEFLSDNDRLGRILFALANCELKPEFRISYTTSDPEAVKNELLGKAVADARDKAVVMAAAAGVALRDIQSIDYSWGEVNFEVRPMMLGSSKMMAYGAADEDSFEMDIEPDDIEVADTVTVVWEIA